MSRQFRIAHLRSAIETIIETASLSSGDTDISDDSIESDEIRALSAMSVGGSAVATADEASSAQVVDKGSGFSGFEVPDADVPTVVLVEGRVRTDGSVDAEIQMQIDATGDDTPDRSRTLVRVDLNLSDVYLYGMSSWIVPAGEAYRIANVNDPTGNNSVDKRLEYKIK